ncbi:hypothetical protein SLS55_002633 [Diplodia seriata]|uniref:Glycosyl hydrolase family 43 protein n=1 Tax=Diplodia seriata TaxID=420778 RepID=A0ABR3CSR9_9PEZI
MHINSSCQSFLSLSLLLVLGGQHASAKPLSFVPRQAESNGTYVTGPVIDQDFPDPCIVYVDGEWWAFATMNADTNIQVARSSDFKEWTYLDGVDALPDPPSWVNMSAPNTWAPDVNELDDGTFVMYFSATSMNDTAIHCIGAATSDTIEGPYTPVNATLACPIEQGGAIDAAGFKDWETRGSGWGPGGQSSSSNSTGDDGDDNCYSNPEWSNGGAGGQRYIVYKVDGNTQGNGGLCGNTIEPIASTPIMLLAVAADGITPQGSPVAILDNAGASDDGIVEAPSLIKTWDGQYVLFFSSGCYSTENYTVSYAISAADVAGPYDRADAPLLQTGDYDLVSPGGMDVHWDASAMVFHAQATAVPLVRDMWAARVRAGDGAVEV